jgi:hypothetical protein
MQMKLIGLLCESNKICEICVVAKLITNKLLKLIQQKQDRKLLPTHSGINCSYSQNNANA